jgi:hypothetical protein
VHNLTCQAQVDRNSLPREADALRKIVLDLPRQLDRAFEQSANGRWDD